MLTADLPAAQLCRELLHLGCWAEVLRLAEMGSSGSSSRLRILDRHACSSCSVMPAQYVYTAYKHVKHSAPVQHFHALAQTTCRTMGC